MFSLTKLGPNSEGNETISYIKRGAGEGIVIALEIPFFLKFILSSVSASLTFVTIFFQQEKYNLLSFKEQ